MKHAMRGRNCFGQEVPAIGQMAVWDLKPAKIYTDYVVHVMVSPSTYMPLPPLVFPHRVWHPRCTNTGSVS